MQDDGDRSDKYDGGGRIVAKIPFGDAPNADQVWLLYKRARSFGSGAEFSEEPLRRRYNVERRGPESLYLNFNDYGEE